MLANMKSCHTRMPSSSHRSWKASALVHHGAADPQHVHPRVSQAFERGSGSRRHLASRRARSSGVQHTPRQNTSTPLIVRPNPSPSVPRSTVERAEARRARGRWSTASPPDSIDSRTGYNGRLPVRVWPPALHVADSEMALQHRLPGWQTRQSQLADASAHVASTPGPPRCGRG